MLVLLRIKYIGHGGGSEGKEKICGIGWSWGWSGGNKLLFMVNRVVTWMGDE